MDDVEEITAKLLKFRDDRDWAQFHNPKDLAISLLLEAAEVLEHFQWKSVEEMSSYTKANKKEISKELADVLYWVLLMSNDMDIDIKKALENKMKENNKKYPIAKAKGNHTKYHKL